MEKLALDDILDVDTYELVRPEYRRRVIDHKAARRLGVGDKVTLVFEDRETLRYQIQEMTRVEQIRDPEKVMDEIDAYNALVPDANELSATLFIEIPDLAQVKPELDRLVGIDECVALVIAGDDGVEPAVVRARFDAGQMEEDRISAVQYIRFRLTPEEVARFAVADGVSVRIDHPSYRHEAVIPDAVRASLVRDLEGPGASLLDVEAARRLEPPKDEIVETGDAVQVRRPHRRLAPEHWIVESLEPTRPLEEADDALLLELVRKARDIAAVASRRGARPRIVAELGAERGTAGARAAFHVLSGSPPPKG